MTDNEIEKLLKKNYPKILELTFKVNNNIALIKKQKNIYKLNNMKLNKNEEPINDIKKELNNTSINVLVKSEIDLVNRYDKIIEDLPNIIQIYLKKELYK